MNRLGTKLIAGFLLLVLMIVALSFYAAYASQKSLQESIGQSSVFVANEMLVNIDMTIYNWIDRFELRALTEAIQKMVSASNRDFDGMTSVSAYMDRMDKEWEAVSKGESWSNVQKIVGNDVSVNLREQYFTHYEKKLGTKIVSEVIVTNR
jgi:hypothetical protein